MDVREALDADRVECRRHPWELARVEVVDRLLRAHTNGFSGPDNVVLDIGCGDGFVAYALAVRYPHVRFLGIDTALNDEAIAVLADRVCAPNLDLRQSLDQCDCGERTVSAVLLLDLLEHVEDDEMFLDKLAKNPILRPGTVFVVTVPAFQRLFSSHDRLLSHFRRYTISRLKKTVGNAGMDIVEYGDFFAVPLIPRLVRAGLEKGLHLKGKRHTGISTWKGNALLTYVLKTVLVLDFALARFLRRFGLGLPGLSCYIVCRTQVS